MDGEIKRVILYIDGVIMHIERPDHAGDAYFCGRHGKSCDSFNVQYVVHKRGAIRQLLEYLEQLMTKLQQNGHSLS